MSDSSRTIYDAWQSTLAPFLVPACVLSAWPVFMIVCAGNRTPLKLLCMLGLVSLADGLLGSCAYPLLHQYAFSPWQNNALFYAGSACYWLGGLAFGPVLEGWGTRQSAIVLSLLGLLGALGSMQEFFVLALVGRCCSATATTGLSTLVEYVLYDEARLRPAHASPSGPGSAEHDDGGSGSDSGDPHGDHEAHASAERGHGIGQEGAEGHGGGMLTMFHQLRPVSLWAAMLVGQYAMTATPHISTGPCWAAAGCYVVTALMAWKLLPAWSAAEAFKLTSRLRSLSSTKVVGAMERRLPGFATAARSGSATFAPSPSSVAGAAVSSGSLSGFACEATLAQRWLRYFVGSYVLSVKTFLNPRLLARHLVDVFFGGLFLTLSLVWVPTLEMYDDSIPFGFIFQIFMIAQFLGATFSLPVWAYGWAEAALVVLLSVTARVLNTSRDYAIPVTIMFAGVAMHCVAGVVRTTGSLWRAEYPSAAAPLTFLFFMKALSGICGWVFLNGIDGKYMEDVYVFEARWVYGLMWLEAVALAQYVAKRAAQHRSTNSNYGVSGSGSASGVRIVASGLKDDGLRESSSAAFEASASVHVEADTLLHHHHMNASAGSEGRVFK